MTISLERLLAQIEEDLAIAHPEDRAPYERVAVEPELTPIVNDPRHQDVWVVAKFGDQALFYDDVEGGFNVSILVDGNLTEPGYSQDPLGGAIHTWHELRERAYLGVGPDFGPPSDTLTCTFSAWAEAGQLETLAGPESLPTHGVAYVLAVARNRVARIGVVPTRRLSVGRNVLCKRMGFGNKKHRRHAFTPKYIGVCLRSPGYNQVGIQRCQNTPIKEGEWRRRYEER